MSGIFITFEGGEGCGKSTQVSLLNDRLTDMGYSTMLLREPGGTPAGERIRDILLAKESDGLTPVAELMLYEAARAQIVQQIIRPALAQGKIVLCDRFTDSTLAYQGYGRGLGPQLVKQLNDVATGGLTPTLTFMLFIDPALGLARAMGATGGDGQGDRIEAAGLDFHQRVAEGFARIAMEDPLRVTALSAEGPIKDIHDSIMARLLPLLP